MRQTTTKESETKMEEGTDPMMGGGTLPNKSETRSKTMGHASLSDIPS